MSGVSGVTGVTGRAFHAELRDIDAGLVVPIPARVRVLRELESDLEALRRRFEARGMSAEDARARALEALLPGRRAMEELSRVHAPLYRRLTGRIHESALRRVERASLFLATAGVVVVGGSAVLRIDLFRDPSVFLWPVLGLGGCLLGAVAAKAFQLWIKGDHSEPARGLSTIAALSVAVLLLGCAGVLVDFFLLAATLEQAPEAVVDPFLGWLLKDAALLTLSLSFSLGGGLGWFVLSGWLALVDGARDDLLGQSMTPGGRSVPRAPHIVADPPRNQGDPA